METSDIIAIVATSGTVLSFGVAGWALVYARSQAATAQKALAASERAADAGEKSAEAADRAAQDAQRSADAAEEANRIAARALELSEPPAVAWKIEHYQNSAYTLRNVGTREATGVTVDTSRLNGAVRSLPDGATIAAGDAVRFMVISNPNTLFLTWDGQTEPVAVPMPTRASTGTPRLRTGQRDVLPPPGMFGSHQ
ncbi:hypothetical protein IU436_30760 [Nocardia farcinica]|uniref:hypothetical protein n=1 Tax=Nocardia farcinica TaxID=37329 RepID=UPI001894A4AB|nr:hypothetical protein [Nocardia farcinica]MBF6422967.1 hypothetical protein [Nocardia farcinica]MBF6434691.1 hypothetical protein [Nocardia farcinica]MBF6505798.1 hypothetical protein [Nocardia farcinica]